SVCFSLLLRCVLLIVRYLLELQDDLHLLTQLLLILIIIYTLKLILIIIEGIDHPDIKWWQRIGIGKPASSETSEADSGPEANTSSHRRARGTSLVFSRRKR
ncbi:hypothetical protein L9F63_009679, partial [Diploptera punctata]